MTKKNHKGAKGPTHHLRPRNTRSSKGRLLSQTPSSSVSLSSQLSLLGLYAAPTLGDGNCLFRALSDQVYGSPSRHAEVRSEVCEWIEQWSDRYEGFVEGDFGDDSSGKGKEREGGEKMSKEQEKERKKRRLDKYLTLMRENGTYGGHMELSAFAHMTRRNIKVVQPGLVYVIEWRAGSGTSASQETSTTPEPRRSKRVPSLSSPSPSKTSKLSKDEREGKEVTKVKTGHGYYVLEEVSSESDGESSGLVLSLGSQNGRPHYDDDPSIGNQEEEENGGLTVYVAYHDWEHFSSIRNLRGPHTGLPCIRETPADANLIPEPPAPTNSNPKELERERKKEREMERKKKEKERKEQSSLKLKLKLSSPSNSSPSLVPASSTNGNIIPSGSADPLSIPLPTSRSVSPFPSSTCSSSLPNNSRDSLLAAPSPQQDSRMQIQHLLHPASPSTYPSPSLSVPSSLSPLSSTLSPPPVQATASLHRLLDTPNGRSSPDVTTATNVREQYRSPKRSFDESSASGGEDAEGSSQGREKRSRRRVGSTSAADIVSAEGSQSTDAVVVDADMEGEADIDIDVEAADTPGLSAPGSSTSSSSSSRSTSEEAASPSASPPPEATFVTSQQTTPKNTKHATTTFQHQHHLHGDKQLTRRQRKALGLPKARKFSLAQSGKPVSAGKIVIPGGKWIGRPASATAGGVAEDEADQEWRRNGNGRLDVRGFRELKI